MSNLENKIYSIKEIYYTLQGEGFHSGRPAVFCRFSGCNLWSGREVDRATAICQFCDTNFWGTDGENGGKYASEALAEICSKLWPDPKSASKFVVFTGGEPMLQLDERLIDAFKQKNFEIAVETNGTIEVPNGIDWICMSPKANTEIIVQKGHELKLVFPQKNAEPDLYEGYDFEHNFLQPMDGPDIEENIKKCIKYCKENPKWKLSLQTHKILNIP